MILMTKIEYLQPKFVDTMPSALDSGVLYISKKYKTASHLCCCGCGNRVVTPLKPGWWSLRIQKKKVSISPSIGNWNFPCQAHYWVRNDQVVWAEQWSKEKVEAGRAYDQYIREKHFDAPSNEGFWSKLFKQLFKN